LLAKEVFSITTKKAIGFCTKNGFSGEMKILAKVYIFRICFIIYE